MVVVGAVDGKERVMAGFREDLRVMLIVSVVEVAGSAPGARAGVAVRSFLGFGGRGCCGWESLGNAN